MKKINKILSLVMSLVMVVSLFVGIDITSVAEYGECAHLNTTEYPVTEPTCEEDGYTAGVYCDDCDEWISGHEWLYSQGHDDWNQDMICDNCAGTMMSIKAVADKTKLYPGETFNVSVYFENAKGIKDGSVEFTDAWDGSYELIEYDFNDNLTFFETESKNEYNFSFKESVESNSVEIVTVTFKAITFTQTHLFFYGKATGFIVDDSAHLQISIICPHLNISEYPEESPTCTKTGYLSGVRCDDCYEWISGHERLEAIGHIDKDNDNICDACDYLISLHVCENIIKTDSGMTSVPFKAEKAGLYKFEYSDGIRFGRWDYSLNIDFNNNKILCFSENDEIIFNISASDYDEETYFIRVTLVDDSITDHCDKDFDGNCDYCARLVTTSYFVDFDIEDAQAVITKGNYDSNLKINANIPVQDSYPEPYEDSYWYGGVSSTATWLYPYYTEIDKEYNENKYVVTEISEGAFIDYDKMEYIVIPSSVKTIGAYAVGYTAKSPDAKIDNFIIYGYKNSAAQVYAQENGFEFRPLFVYEIVNNEIVVTAVSELFELIDIPDEAESYPITTIGENCFADCNLYSFCLSENITTLKSGSFRNNPKLGAGDVIVDGEIQDGLIIRDSLKIVEDGVFDGCVINVIRYYGTPKQWNEISIGKNNDSFKNANIVFYGAGHKDFDYVIENDSVKINGIKYYSTNYSNLVVPGTLDGYPVTRLAIDIQYNEPDYYQITIPDSVISIDEKSIGYYMDWDVNDIVLIPGFKIIGVPGSYAETYANENGITFEALAEEPEEPTTEEPETESTTKEPETQAPTTEKPSERPSTDGPAIDGPATDGPTEKPVSDKLEVKDDTVKVDNTSKVSTVKTKSSANDILKSVKNEKVSIVDKDGKAVSGDAFVGTGAKIQIKDNNGKVINTYTVCVPTDVDGNGKTTAADARLALRGSAKLDKVEGVYATASDMNADGKITAADARKILRISAGLE